MIGQSVKTVVCMVDMILVSCMQIETAKRLKHQGGTVAKELLSG